MYIPYLHTVMYSHNPPDHETDQIFGNNYKKYTRYI